MRWQFAAVSDLPPGPIGMVAVAVTTENGREQCDVKLWTDPASQASLSLRARHHVAHWASDADECPQVQARDADMEGAAMVRTSAYGDWDAADWPPHDARPPPCSTPPTAEPTEHEALDRGALALPCRRKTNPGRHEGVRD
ncbi:hypothetical protein [Kitasatospora aureofaciens]|uniref:hypothetical protein n=1 Tax=Kitasatospora aureofaciens TaxID=1894 RepID=UPI001C45FF0C|nr:hypothetical protein [Kitasatospora aureofaciens]MBV6701710.1 hypothetical protein [Kitasatospora aureofaciens]